MGYGKRLRRRLLTAASVLWLLFLSLFVFADDPFAEMDAIADEATASKVIRVGVFYASTAQKRVTLESESGFTVYVSAYGEAASYVEATTLTATLDGGMLTVTDSDGKVVAAAAEGSVEFTSASDDGILGLGGKSYRGAIRLMPQGDGMTVINVVSVEDYLRGVLPSEVYPSWNAEALKAAAVVTRTYSLRTILSSPHASSGFDICTSTHCQVYGGTSKEHPATDKALEDTAGQVLLYDGKLALTPYHSSSGGATASAAAVWGGDPAAYPYLASVETPYEDYRNVPNGKWITVISPAELHKRAGRAYAARIDTETMTFDITRDKAGFAVAMTVTDASGKSVKLSNADSIRSFFGSLVKSANFGLAKTFVPGDETIGAVTVLTVGGEKTVTGFDGFDYLTADGVKHADGLSEVYVFDGQGYGHGVGMSQFGARCMADAGFTYDEIVRTYFPGTVIAPFEE